MIVPGDLVTIRNGSTVHEVITVDARPCAAGRPARVGLSPADGPGWVVVDLDDVRPAARSGATA